MVTSQSIGSGSFAARAFARALWHPYPAMQTPRAPARARPCKRMVWQCSIRCNHGTGYWAASIPEELGGQLYHDLWAQDTLRLADRRAVCVQPSARYVGPGSYSHDIPICSFARSRSAERDCCTFVAMRRQFSPQLQWSVVGIAPTFTGLGTELFHTTPDAAETAWITRQRNAELDAPSTSST